MSKQPFLIFPWQRPFLPDLVNLVQSMSGNEPENATIIVPNQRPWRYIMKIFQDQKRCVLLPKIVSFSELVALWREPTASKRRIITNPLDQVALLYKCITELKSTDSALESHLTSMDIASFFPWGMRLAALLEELFIQGKEPANLAHLDGEVAPPAAALLGALGRISHAWRELLCEKNFTTPGFEQFLAAQAAKKDSSIPPQLIPGEDRLVFIAGFSTLNGTDDVLLRTLWKAGAHICLHTDPALLKNEAPHWACSEQKDWIKRWKAQARAAIELSKEEEEFEPQRTFFAGYDLHSQLEALAKDLKPDDSVSTAVVLTNSSLLIPVLHHLPKTKVFSTDVIISYLFRRALEKDIHFDVTITGDIRFMTESVLEEALLNTLLADLGENAIIATAKAERRNILLSLGVRDGQYCIDVFDSGADFDAGVIENLGRRRYTTHKSEGGSGIGLMTTLEILEKKKGSFELEELRENCLFTKRVSIVLDRCHRVRISSNRKELLTACEKQGRDIILTDK